MEEGKNVIRFVIRLVIAKGKQYSGNWSGFQAGGFGA
jgi:hypothetical protein